MIEQFNQQQLRRGILPSSVDRRELDLKKFLRWLAPSTLIDAQPSDVEAFILCRNWNERTTYAFLSHLHAFYVWAMAMDLVDADPTVKILRPRVRPGLPRPVSDDELAYILSQAEGNMKAWIMLGSFEGLRCMEIAGLERNDISETHIRVMGKGQKEREVPLHPLVWRALIQAPIPRFGPCFKTKEGHQIKAAHLSALGNRFIRHCGVDATMHQLRHWFGTSTYQNCQDILAVGAMMGHSSPATTKIYAQHSSAVAIAAVQSLSVSSN